MEAVCEISLSSILQNYLYFKSRVDASNIIPVVKANAYGHGALEVTKFLSDELGVSLFAVATLEEAQALSIEFPAIKVLIFSRVFPAELADLPKNAIVSIGSMEDALSLSDSSKVGLKVHLNVNTGMNRLGVPPEQAIELIQDRNLGLDIQGVYSHFSSSDTLSETRFKQQRSIFRKFTTDIKTLGFKGLIHLSNSAGILHDEIETYDAIRLGIGLYGYDTSAQTRYQSSLSPAMEVKAPLIRIARISAGESVSYAEKWHAAVDTNIGTLRIGYADGYSRALTNRGYVSFEGRTFPVIGTVTMDHIMIDLGEETPNVGGMFTVMGGEHEAIKIASIAKNLNTIPYELCCAISNRVKRQYLIH
ncbi:MAG: alanine racemase [Candidatus Marinimicrobia bacterium]|nr:alanine racemase [Candidatus Neomarinimicrobiota bacterium]